MILRLPSENVMEVNEIVNSESHIKEELCNDDGLLSMEKLDRASPDLWPEKIPGLADFIAMSNTPIRTPACESSRVLSEDDMATILEFGNMTPNALILEIKELYHELYLLGVSEAREMIRGKYLGVFSKVKKRFHD